VMFSGLLSLPCWGLVAVAFALTHTTIAAVTIYLHRMQAHRALELHPFVSHFFRFWLWLTTGMITKEWIAIHRKHHAKCETADDPHSPKILGIHRVLWGGVFLYVKEAHDAETMIRYGHGAPADWVERHIYSNLPRVGITLMAIVDIALFGLLPGLLIYGVQMVWIPFWAAGVINGLGHHFGYRTYACKDVSTNIVPWGILIGGEELHNNHHAFVTSAKFSTQWYEVDLGWMYIRLLEIGGLATVKRIAPKRRLIAAKTVCDLDTLQAIVTHRYEVLAKYGRTVMQACIEEMERRKPRVRSHKGTSSQLSDAALSWLPRALVEKYDVRSSTKLRVLCSMGQELSALWEARTSSREQLLRQLQDWCRRAEASQILPLQRFSRELRRYG
jgi:stearoyl-CoA desaturase (delta-9 desaturase)